MASATTSNPAFLNESTTPWLNETVTEWMDWDNDTHTDNHTHNDTHVAAHGSVHDEGGPTAILFIFVSCALGALVRTIFIKRVRLPYTVILLMIGLIIGVFSTYVPGFSSFTAIASIGPHTLLHAFMPVLIFESAFAMESHLFLKSFLQIIILAIPGLLFSAFLTAVFSMNVFNYGWGWSVSMMFGAIISATDPVAVVAVLKDLGASKQLTTLVEGESLMNDGAAIVLYEIFLELSLPGADVSAGNIVLKLLIVVFGGTLFGFVMAKLTILWLVNIFNDALTEITITLAATYITYYVGEEYLQVSGVLSVVVLGVTMNTERTSISPEVETFLHRFWEMMAYLANTLIFILVGVVVMHKAVAYIEDADWAYLVALYCAINVIRAMTVAMFSPILSRIGYGMNWQNASILTWGGLRGAVGLALSLAVAQIPDIDPTGRTQHKILIHSAGIVILTLLINATTCSTLLRVLGMSEISIPKRLAMASAVRNLQDMLHISFRMFESDRFLADADWDVVNKYTEIEDPYKTMDEEANLDDLTGYQRVSTCPHCETCVPNEPSPREMQEMRNEGRLRLLKAEKISYWKQFEHGMLSREAVRKLVEVVDTAEDLDGGFVNTKDIRKTWEITGIYPLIKKKLERWQSNKPDVEEIPPPTNYVMHGIYKVAMHSAFDIILYIVILANIITVIWELVIENTLCKAEVEAKYGIAFPILNYIFIALYLIEFLIKIFAFRKHYFFSHWNQFDFAILLLSLVDLITELTYFNLINDDPCASESSTSAIKLIDPRILKIAKAVRLLRLLRGLRLVKGLIPQLIDIVNMQINKNLRFGYDVGKGFISGEEEIHSLIDHMIDNKKIAKEMKQTIVHGRLTIIKELGALQKNHPGIAVSIKTHQAARRVLNNLRDKILELRSEGVLDEAEANKLEVMVETRMKKLHKIPATIQPPPPEKIIGNLSWVSGDPDLIEYIKHNAHLESRAEGEELTVEADPKGGIYVIISGLARVERKLDYGDAEESNDAQFSRAKSARLSAEKFCDYVSTGSVLGEMALLTGKPSRTKIFCDTSVQMYHISYEAIQAALELFTEEPSMEHRLWRLCAIRIATGILMSHAFFRSWSQEKIKMHLQKCVIFVKKLEIPEGGHFNAPYERFDIDQLAVSDTILIHGVVEDTASGKWYTGPKYIPNKVDCLAFIPGKTDTHVLVMIPRAEGYGGSMERRSSNVAIHSSHVIDQPVNHYISPSAMCLQHASHERSELMHKISEHKVHDGDHDIASKLHRSISKLTAHNRAGQATGPTTQSPETMSIEMQFQDDGNENKNTSALPSTSKPPAALPPVEKKPVQQPGTTDASKNLHEVAVRTGHKMSPVEAPSYEVAARRPNNP